METEYGHVLVYGVTEALTEAFDFSSINVPLATVLGAAAEHGAVAAPAHPGRPKVGMFAHTDELGIPEGICIVETLNGGSRDDEDQIAKDGAAANGYQGIGGSDSHIVSHIGRCGTRFENPFQTIDDLVQELNGGQFEAVSLTEA